MRRSGDRMYFRFCTGCPDSIGLRNSNDAGGGCENTTENGLNCYDGNVTFCNVRNGKQVKKGIDFWERRCYHDICAVLIRHMRKCRNWQTSKTKDLVVVTPCGFKSHLPQLSSGIKSD